MPIEWISLPKCNLPFDSPSRYSLLSKERLACLTTLEHYIEIGSVKELPLQTTDSLSSTFPPVLKKGTNKMSGCIDLCRPNQHIWYEHFKMEGLHTIRSLSATTTSLRRSTFPASTCTSSSGKPTAGTCGSCGRARNTSASTCPSNWPQPGGSPRRGWHQ